MLVADTISRSFTTSITIVGGYNARRFFSPKRHNYTPGAEEGCNSVMHIIPQRIVYYGVIDANPIKTHI